MILLFHSSDLMKQFRIKLILGFVSLVLFTGSIAQSQSDVELVPQHDQNRIQVRIDGELFTNYIVDEYPLPILYPIYGPDGLRMNRQYPMKEGVQGESSDHPHHKSLMYTHGKMNGVDFWHQGGAKTVHSDVLDIGDNYLKTRNRWVDEDGTKILTDTRKITFRSVPKGRAIDYEITLHASEGDLNIGDTKEGTMGFRTHPNLRIDKGAHAINSNGTEGKPVWGESAKWVHYSDKIDGKKVGVAIFDHPTNPRHPTTWHARDYGLISANPFGYSHYKGNKHNGSMTVQEGGEVTFSYRFLFIRGDHEDANIKQRYRRYAKKYKPSYVPEKFDLQFNEHFLDEQSLQQFSFSSPGDWSREPIMNGARHVLQQNKDGEDYKPPHRSPHNIGLVNEPSVNSFLLDFNAKQIGEEYNHMDVCVFYNFVDPANYYYTHMGVSRDKHAHQTFIVDDAPRTAITNHAEVDRSVDWTDRQWHHIRVFRDGESGEIEVYIDDMDEPEMTASDTTHAFGRIGFGSFDDQAQFKNIQLYAPDQKKSDAPDFFQSKNPLSISPSGGQFYHPQKVKVNSPLSNGDQHHVRYTTDGSTPSASSPIYNEPIKLTSDTTLKVALFKKEKRISGIKTASFDRLSKQEYQSLLHVKDLNVKTGASYEVVEDGIEEGDRVFVDRSYEFTEVPAPVKEMVFIRTANDDSGASGTVAQFRTNVPGTVYIALDERADRPDWMASFKRTDHVLQTTDVPFRLYRKSFPAGKIRLGGNNAPSMYQVFLNKSSN